MTVLLQRILPPQRLEAGEVGGTRAEFCTILDGESRKMSVACQVGRRARFRQAVTENFPVTFRFEHDSCVGVGQPLVDVRERVVYRQWLGKDKGSVERRKNAVSTTQARPTGSSADKACSHQGRIFACCGALRLIA